MKIEVLEPRLNSDGFWGEQGDIFSVPNNVGIKWCEQGWVRDLSNNTKTGDRLIVETIITPHDQVNGQISPGV